MSQIKIRRERYKIYENDEWVGYFNVDYSADGRKMSADLFKSSASFVLITDKNGHVEGRKMELWVQERIIPPTRIGVENNLKAMGLSEYDELAILKHTSARHTSDACMIDFSEKQ